MKVIIFLIAIATGAYFTFGPFTKEGKCDVIYKKTITMAENMQSFAKNDTQRAKMKQGMSKLTDNRELFMTQCKSRPTSELNKTLELMHMQGKMFSMAN